MSFRLLLPLCTSILKTLDVTHRVPQQQVLFMMCCFYWEKHKSMKWDQTSAMHENENIRGATTQKEVSTTLFRSRFCIPLSSSCFNFFTWTEKKILNSLSILQDEHFSSENRGIWMKWHEFMVAWTWKMTAQKVKEGSYSFHFKGLKCMTSRSSYYRKSFSSIFQNIHHKLQQLYMSFYILGHVTIWPCNACSSSNCKLPSLLVDDSWKIKMKENVHEELRLSYLLLVIL